MSRRSDIRRATRYVIRFGKDADGYIQKEVIPKIDLSCVKGCCACCKQVVTITIPEAITIVEPIMADAGQRVVFEYVLKIKLNKQVKYCHDKSKNASTWFEEMVPCIFLDEKSGLCRIYDRRPPACRMHMVISDPLKCAPPSGQEMNVVNFVDWFELAANVSLKAAGELGIPVGMAPFPIAISNALTVILWGPDALRKKQQGTVFEDEVQGALYWAERFLDSNTTKQK